MSKDILRITRPINVTDGMLSEVNVPESNYDAWSADTTYQEGKRVYLATNNLVYQSVKDENTGNNPSDIGSAFWVKVGPTNRWAMFDASYGTKTKNPSTISFTITPNQVVSTFAAVALVDASSVQITVSSEDGGGVIYDETFDLSAGSVEAGWWQFFFGDRSRSNQLTVFNLPPRIDAVITVMISGGDDLAVGTILFGETDEIGLGISLGSRVGIRDYSRKETNEFGESVLVQRAYAHRMTLEVLIESSHVDVVQNILSDVRALPILWTATDKYKSMNFVGFYKNFEILISYPNHAFVELEIEGIP